MSLKWKEIDQLNFNTLLSTGQLQPMDIKDLPSWVHENPKFSEAWIIRMNIAYLKSTEQISTMSITAMVDMERTSTTGKPLRYYRYLYIKMEDGRVFQAGPIKKFEYERHRDERPDWLKSYSTYTP